MATRSFALRTDRIRIWVDASGTVGSVSTVVVAMVAAVVAASVVAVVAGSVVVVSAVVVSAGAVVGGGFGGGFGGFVGYVYETVPCAPELGSRNAPVSPRPRRTRPAATMVIDFRIGCE